MMVHPLLLANPALTTRAAELDGAEISLRTAMLAHAGALMSDARVKRVVVIAGMAGAYAGTIGFFLMVSRLVEFLAQAF